MSVEGLFVLAALLAAFVAVYRNWLSADIALMAGLSAVAIGGIVEPVEAVGGFASTAVVAVAALYVVAAGLWRAGWPEEVLPERYRERLVRAADRAGLREIDPFAQELGRDDSLEAPRRWIGYASALSVLVLPLAGVLRLETAALLGAAALVVSGVLSAKDARDVIDWEVVVVVGAVIGFSRALVSTGVVEALGTSFYEIGTATASPPALAAAFMTAVVLAALTNRRAAASILPLAVSVGLLLGPAGLV